MQPKMEIRWIVKGPDGDIIYWAKADGTLVDLEDDRNLGIDPLTDDEPTASNPIPLAEQAEIWATLSGAHGRSWRVAGETIWTVCEEEDTFNAIVFAD